MGCWNETDALTQLPILPGDPVKLIVVTSHSDELTFPRCFPISGIYDDYGSIEKIEEDWATASFLAYCNQKMESGRWSFAEKEEVRIKMDGVKLPFVTIVDLLRAIEREYIVSNEWNSVAPVFFVMIHDDLYAKAIELGGGSGYDDPILERMKKDAASLLKDLDGIRGSSSRVFFTACLSIQLFGARLGSIGGSLIRDVYGDSCFGGCYENKEAPPESEYIQRILELACLNLFLMLTRKKFYKQAGRGSQDAEFHFPALFFEHAKFFAMKKYAEQEDEWDDE